MATLAELITSARYDLRDYADREYPDPELVEYANRSVIALDSALLSINSDWLHHTGTAILASGQNKVTQPTRCISIRSMWISDNVNAYTDLTFAAAGDTITSAALADFEDDDFVANQYIGIDGTTNNDTEDIGLVTLSSVATLVLTVNENVIVDEGSGDQSASIFPVKSEDVIQRSRDDIAARRKFLGSDGKPQSWSHEGTNVLFDYIANQAYGIVFHFNQKSETLTTSSNMPYNDEFNEELRQAMVFIAENREMRISEATTSLYDFFKSAANTKLIRRNFIPKRYKLDF